MSNDGFNIEIIDQSHGDQAIPLLFLNPRAVKDLPSLRSPIFMHNILPTIGVKSKMSPFFS